MAKLNTKTTITEFLELEGYEVVEQQDGWLHVRGEVGSASVDGWVQVRYMDVYGLKEMDLEWKP